MAEWTEVQQNQARMFDVMTRASADPEIAGAVTGTDPQPVFAGVVTKCPVRDLGGASYSLARVTDLRYVNTHPAVEQGLKYLGSDRPAIPFGIDMAVALTAWHERIPDYSIAPGETLTYAGNPRAPHRLPLVWG